MIGDEAAARQFCAARVDSEGMARLERLAVLLAEENAAQNLVSDASLLAVWERHFADSLQMLDHVPRGTSPWMDLGSGAGLPGLPLAIARPQETFFLIESRKRRIEWLRRAAAELGLDNCRVIGARLENVETFPAAAITARAFAPLGKLLHLSARFSTRDTLWLLPKGRSAGQELENQSEPIRKMFHVEHSQTDPGGGILVGKGKPDLS